MVLTAYFVLSPATNSSCHRHWRIKAHQTRSDLISPPPAWHQQRVSGPHGFAVREKRRSSCTPADRSRGSSRPAITNAPGALASTASRPAFVTTRDPPLKWDGTMRISELICVRPKEKYFCKRGWTGFRRTD